MIYVIRSIIQSINCVLANSSDCLINAGSLSSIDPDEWNQEISHIQSNLKRRFLGFSVIP